MQINIIVVGRLKEKYWDLAVAEYSKRLGSYTRVIVREIPEERLPDNPSAAEIENALQKEGERIAKHLTPSQIVFPLVIEGKMLSSEELAQTIAKMTVDGKSHLTFIIGSSHGLSPEVIRKGDFPLSFSRLTFPHQMMRVILLEQLYRAFSIIKGSKYHK